MLLLADLQAALFQLVFENAVHNGHAGALRGHDYVKITVTVEVNEQDLASSCSGGINVNGAKSWKGEKASDRRGAIGISSAYQVGTASVCAKVGHVERFSLPFTLTGYAHKTKGWPGRISAAATICP